MIFKWGLNELIETFNIILAELESTKTETRVLNVQIIANEFNGLSNLCFRKSFVIF